MRHCTRTPDDPFVTLTNAGVYAVKLRVVNEAGNVAESTTACTVTLQAPAKPLPVSDRFVVAHNLNAAEPYDTWETAAESIQTAVNATTANGDFRLSRESPAINTGLNQDWMLDAVDLDGNRRIDAIHNQVDIGAYEYRYAATIILIR